MFVVRDTLLSSRTILTISLTAFAFTPSFSAASSAASAAAFSSSFQMPASPSPAPSFPPSTLRFPHPLGTPPVDRRRSLHDSALPRTARTSNRNHLSHLHFANEQLS